jgi:hypothetical protein
VVERHNPSLGRPSSPYAMATIGFVVGTLALVLLHGSLRGAR